MQRTTAASRTISGVVNLPVQAPTDWYQGVWVYAVDADGDQAGVAPANSAGAYSITGLAPGVYTLRVISDVYVDASNHEVAPNLVDQIAPTAVDVTGADASGQDFTLQQGMTVSGWAWIMAGRDAGLMEVHTVDGELVSRKSIQDDYQNAVGASFKITGVPTGTFLLGASLVEFDGSQWFWRTGQYSRYYADPEKFTVASGQSVTNLHAQVTGTNAVTGTITTYGFAGSSGAILSDTSVRQKLSDGSWARLPWGWAANPAVENGVSPFELQLGPGTFTIGFGPHEVNPYTGNGAVVSSWWDHAGSVDTATPVYLISSGGKYSDLCGSVHPTSVTFTDVPADYSFLKEISWMASKGITTGYAGDCSTKSFNPWGNVTRDAMAAFLYRYAGSPAVSLPASSPFIDVDPSHPFYKEIVWLSAQGITNGWTTPSGTEYRPSQPITRDAMAAFLYRYAGKPASDPPATSPFADVPTDNSFYTEITWLASTGISTGWSVPTGKEYRPYNNITRDAMAAFLYRYDSRP